MYQTESSKREKFVENGEVTSIRRVEHLENIVEITVKDKQKQKHTFRYENPVYPLDVHGRVDVTHLPYNDVYHIERYGIRRRRTVAYAELVNNS